MTLEERYPLVRTPSGFLSNGEQDMLYELSCLTHGLKIEIGCLLGRSTCAIAAGMEGPDKLLCIDPFQTELVGGATTSLLKSLGAGKKKSYHDMWLANLKMVGVDDRNIDWKIGTAEGVLHEVAHWIGVDTVEFLFLDADHSEKSTRDILEGYLPLIGDRAVVAFHDHDPRWGQWKVVQDYLNKGILRETAQVGCLLVTEYWSEFDEYEEIR